MVVNATDIQIYLAPSEGGTMSKIVHIVEGSLSLESSTRPVVTQNSGIWEEDVVTKMRWTITGMSHHTYAPGYSFATLFTLWKSAASLPVKYKLKDSGGEVYTGMVKIVSLRTGGNTGQNASLSYTLKGQGEILDSES